MSITKRITKFLLIAALAFPAWNAASAQKPTAPPEKATTENQVLEKAKDLKGHSVAKKNLSRGSKPQTAARKKLLPSTPKLSGNRAVRQLDIYNGGTTTQERVPIYGYWLDAANHGQMIYPADSLTDIVGAKITSITFHASSAISSTSGSTDAPVTLKIGKTNQNNFSSSTSFIDVSSFTSSCTLSTIFNNAKDITFNFTTPFTYNGGNLLLDMSCEDGGSNYGHIYWISKSVSNASLQQYSDYNATVQNYLPYITVTYQVTPTEPYLASLAGNGAFGEVKKGTTKSTTITVLNGGTSAFTPQLVSSDPAFTVSGDMTTQLASDQSRDFTVTFSPTKVQEYSGTLTLSAPESQDIFASVALSGAGVNTVTVADGSDGSTTTTSTYVPVWGYWFDNTDMHDQMIYPASMLSGIDGKKIKSITFYVPNGILFGNPTSSNGTGDLDVTLGTTTNEYFNSAAIQPLSGSTVTKTITPEYGSTTMKITFDEAFEYNTSQGNLIIDTKVSEKGGYNSSTNFAGISTSRSQSIYSHTSSDITQLSFLPKITFELEAGVSVDKTELDFGNVEVNTTSAAQTVTVSNSTDEAVALTWSFVNDKFATTATATSVPAGGQVEIPVTFTPTAAGPQSGTLTINAGDETFEVALSGKGLKAYAATINPQTVDFGAVARYSSATATVTLTNTGANAITPTITQPAAPFSVTGDAGALASGETRTYTITFAPTVQETYSGSFTIADADHGISFTVTLTGEGAPMGPLTTNSPVNFGSVDLNSSTTATATFTNPNDVNLTAQLTVTEPFSIPASASPLTIPANGSANVTVTFTPTAAVGYTGSLTATIDGVNTVVALRGAGRTDGPEAVRDSAFYAGISYSWPINVTNPTNSSTLDQIATDPDQMIALIREVYTNKDIPGNYKRGYANTGGTSYFGTHDNLVQYTGAGELKTVTEGSTVYVDFSDTFGWDIPTDDITIDNSGSVSCAYMNPYQYKPDNEGVTLLLLEMLDDFNTSNVTVSATGYAGLRELFSKTLKSVRVITQAKRTGTGEARGTLFNIDCDKMNKFYLLAKGQLGWLRSAWFEHQNSTFTSFYTEPCYIYGSNYDEYVDPALEKFFFLGHMFEQFSPASPNATATELDLYRKMSTAGDAFPVNHDCPNVPYVENGHHFMMYGTESGAADCQDVRDMMFFVPDYRMMDHADRGTKSSTNSSFIYQDYFEYNPNHKPQMGLYVIIQDTVEAVTRADDYFKLKLTWDSNMDEFMPGDQQEYQLYQVVTDEFGVSSWKPVYYTKVVNNQVVYTDKNGNVVTTPVPIVLTLDPSSSKKTYTEVYVQRADASTEVTYAIRGQDTGHFLSLQMSNEQSYVIPGKDPAEMVLMSSATVYSRYEAQNENNCYSNKIQMKAAPKTIKASYLPTGSTMTLNRSYAKVENGATVTVTEPIATLTINTGTKKFTISGSVLSDVESFFPKGTHDSKTAGYHANSSNQISYTTQTIDGTEYINFDLSIWDNFVANVSKNEHPGLYTYQLRFNVPGGFPGLNNQTVYEAYSNPIRVYVYKTDSKVNEPLTLDQVKGDTGCNSAYTPGDVEFSAQVMLSGKGEILRYDAYRWNEGDTRSIIYDGGNTDEDEDDVDPTGMAGNQGATYTVSMNAVGTADYYKGDEVPVTETAPLNWATFVDYYPAKQENGGAFTYAPVVELFTRGYVEGSTTEERGDYNTYGGPLKTTAVGKMELEIPDDLNTAGNPFMSTYKWFDGTNWCAYYKIPVKFHALGIPEGYEIYKIRAWRDVDTSILREELSSRQGRIAANYLFEDLTYGDALGDGHTMSKANLFQNNQGTINSYELGRRAVENYDTDSNIQGETHATFGALRINTDDGQPYAIEDLSATIKVRAYFTKTSNPILSDPIYVIANNGSGWDYDTPLATLTCEDGANFTGTVTIPAANDGSGKGYFFFSKQLGSSWETNAQYIFGPEASGNEVLGEWPNNAGYNLKYWQSGTKVFEVYPGTYQLSIGSHVQDLATSAQYGYQAGYITITRVANSKAPTRDLVPADYGYYVAEGSIEFNSNMFNEIITGVTDVKMEANREVMSVSYVNTVGQVSSTPWQGVNVVVVRYTDGSTSTSKVIK